MFDSEFEGLRGEGIGAAGGGKADDFHAVRDVVRDFKGAGANAAGGAENDDPFPGFRVADR